MQTGNGLRVRSSFEWRVHAGLQSLMPSIVGHGIAVDHADHYFATVHCLSAILKSCTTLGTFPLTC